LQLPDQHAQTGRMEYSKIEEREKTSERRSHQQQHVMVPIANHSKHFY